MLAFGWSLLGSSDLKTIENSIKLKLEIELKNHPSKRCQRICQWQKKIFCFNLNDKPAEDIIINQKWHKYVNFEFHPRSRARCGLWNLLESAGSGGLWAEIGLALNQMLTYTQPGVMLTCRSVQAKVTRDNIKAFCFIAGDVWHSMFPLIDSVKVSITVTDESINHPYISIDANS